MRVAGDATITRMLRAAQHLRIGILRDHAASHLGGRRTEIPTNGGEHIPKSKRVVSWIDAQLDALKPTYRARVVAAVVGASDEAVSLVGALLGLSEDPNRSGECVGVLVVEGRGDVEDGIDEPLLSRRQRGVVEP